MKRIGDHWQKLIGLAIWVGAIAAYVAYASTNHLAPLHAIQELIKLISGTAVGPLIYFLAYLLRSLLFSPSTLLTTAGGYLFGPVLGVFYTIIASNLSSMVAYHVGRYFGNGILDTPNGTSLLQRYAERMRRNSFEATLIMRFIFLPYDMVSYLAGFLHINWQGFLLATALGSIPGTISFVLFGASITADFTGAAPTLDPITLGVGIAMLAVSLALARLFRRREAEKHLGEQTT